MREMLRSGVPASITLAQGMLESDNGNSRLAVKGNNHFGIKCHSDWKGRKIYHDDDERNECFRRYKSVYDSYIDHSEFLREKQRYAFLFELEITDYKGWAKGLKKAGYATHRKYADLLITIIEDNELHKYDLIALEDYDPDEDVNIAQKGFESSGKRAILINNRIDYIIVKPGDSFESLRDELNLIKGELFRYNDLTADSSLRAGQILYLQPKRNRAEAGKDFHVLKQGESLYDVSQVYGVKLEKLYRKNHIEPGNPVQPGTRIYLRKRKPGGFLKEDPLKQSDDDEFEFQFDGG
ncbi:MAG: glucosaminidase domain-containing protein [Bacteroidales bacterium]